MNNLYILIKADYNDGDYTWRKSPITVDQIKEIEPIIQAIKEKGGRYITGECVSSIDEDAFNVYCDIPGFDLFDDFVPHGEFGIHTIESVEIITVITKLY